MHAYYPPPHTHPTQTQPPAAAARGYQTVWQRVTKPLVEYVTLQVPLLPGVACPSRSFAASSWHWPPHSRPCGPAALPGCLEWAGSGACTAGTMSKQAGLVMLSQLPRGPAAPPVWPGWVRSGGCRAGTMTKQAGLEMLSQPRGPAAPPVCPGWVRSGGCKGSTKHRQG